MKRAQLRTQLRQARQALSVEKQDIASQRVCNHLLNLPQVQSATTLAAYIASPSELSLTPFIQALWSLGKRVVVPVVDPQQAGIMWFLPYQASTPLHSNSFGIHEPLLDTDKAVPLTAIDVMCTPLVGFDKQGQRMGMGGGYYDRLLAPWYAGEHSHLVPIGVAHDCQYVDTLPSETWDIPLPLVITPSKLWQFS